MDQQSENCGETDKNCIWDGWRRKHEKKNKKKLLGLRKSTKFLAGLAKQTLQKLLGRRKGTKFTSRIDREIESCRIERNL